MQGEDREVQPEKGILSTQALLSRGPQTRSTAIWVLVGAAVSGLGDLLNQNPSVNTLTSQSHVR